MGTAHPPNNYEYASIYVRSPSSSEVTDLVSRAQVGVVGEFEIKSSDDRTASVVSQDFVLWPTIIEVGAAPADRRIVGEVTRVLVSLWAAGIDAVAACRYEDELPERRQVQPGGE